jgi:5-methylthioribose kinase
MHQRLWSVLHLVYCVLTHAFNMKVKLFKSQHEGKNYSHTLMHGIVATGSIISI